MSYSIRPGSIWGRIGTEAGKGLAEAIPKEAERARLAAGIEQLSKEKGLTPFQQLGRLASLPGVTPQLIQSGGELLKNQSTFEGLGRGNSRNGNPRERMEMTNQGGQPASEAIREQRFGPGGVGSVVPREEQANLNQERPQPAGQPQVSENNPLRPQAQPRGPWTPERRYDEIDYLHEKFPQLTFNEISSMASENEARDLAQPEAERQRDTYNEAQQEKLKNKFQEYLEKNLQKTKEGTYADIT
jgi:hypothetical protein